MELRVRLFVCQLVLGRRCSTSARGTSVFERRRSLRYARRGPRSACQWLLPGRAPPQGPVRQVWQVPSLAKPVVPSYVKWQLPRTVPFCATESERPYGAYGTPQVASELTRAQDCFKAFSRPRVTAKQSVKASSKRAMPLDAVESQDGDPVEGMAPSEM